VLHQALDELRCDADHRDRGDVVKIDPQPRIAHALDHFGKVTVETVIGDILVVKRRQHQHTGAAGLDRVLSESHRIGQGTATGAGHHARRIEACRE
jgi:hypothetical protein